MPALKWGRIDVRDIGGRGLNADTSDGTEGSPILFIQNGFIGTDGRPYPRIRTFESSNGGNFFLAATRIGDGGCVTVDQADQADANGNSGRARWIINQLGSTRNYQVFRGLVGGMTTGAFTGFMNTAAQPVPGSSGFNTRHQRVTVFNNPLWGSVTATPPFIVVAAEIDLANPSIPTGIPVRDVSVVAVVAGSAQQPAGPSDLGTGTNCGEFVLYQNATRWFLTKLVANQVTAGVTPNVVNSYDPAPITGFNTTEIDKVQVWGCIDTVVPFSCVLGVHASGTAGVYMASQTAEYFQGRIVCGNVMFAPKYTVAGDIDHTKYVQKRNRLIWTILPGESPTRGPFAGASEGLTHLQHPWNIEVNNFVDVDGVGTIFQICNLGDNQLFIIGNEGCARLTGYLSTAVAGVNSATFDVRPIMKSPGGAGASCAITTAVGVFYTNGQTIFKYDGNSIVDVLDGAAKSLFDGFKISSSFTGTVDGGPGILDDNHIYFSCIGTFASSANGLLVLNIYTGKWSYHCWGNSSSSIAFQSVQKGAMAFRDAISNTRLVMPGNTINQPYSPFNPNMPGRTMGVGANAAGNSYTYRSQLGPNEPYVIALRPFGVPGIPKRFRHLVVNYALDTPNNATQWVARVRGVYGWVGGCADYVFSEAMTRL